MHTTTKQKPLVPELRFSGFSGGWSENKIGSIVKVERGGSPRPIQNYITSSSDGVPWIKIGDLKNGDRFVTKTAEKIKPEGVKNSREVFPGDFILSNSMSFGRPYIVNIYGCIHDGWLALRNEKQEKVINSFLYILLQSDATKKKFLSLAAGSAVKNLKSETVQLAKISYPNITEQQKIADFLGSVDAWLDNLRGQKTALQSYKQGMMQKLFSGQVRFKDEAGKSFPDWEEKKLGQTSQIVGGGTPDTTISTYWGGKISWYTPTEIKTGKPSASLRTITTAGLNNSSAKVLPIGTILLTTRATIGDVAILEAEAATNQGFQSLIVNEHNHNYFLYFWLQHHKNELIKKANGSTFLEVSSKEIAKIPISLPTKMEQKKIADFLTALDHTITAKGEEITKVEEWKKGLMQKMFV